MSRANSFNCTRIDLFERQLKWLKERYTVLPLLDLLSHLDDTSNKNKDIVSITFDDGYLNFVELALPVLQKYNCHATIFVPSGKVGHYNDWDVAMPRYNKMNIMAYSELANLPVEFVEVGSHGISHNPISSQMPLKFIEEEITVSRVEIEQNIGRSVRLFAFPYGVFPYKQEFFDHDNLKKLFSGYSGACTSCWGRYNYAKDIYFLRRIGVWPTDTFSDFIDKLNGCYDWIEGKEKIGILIKKYKSLFLS